MILVISQHYVKPGQVQTAAARLDANGERMAEVPGFLFRYRLVSADNDHKLSTVTGWQSQAGYDAWLSRRGAGNRGPAFAGGASPYERIETEVHGVERLDGVPAASTT